MRQWLQVELPEIRKITGIITQGARSLGKEMYVTSYTLQYSNDGKHWTTYTDDVEDHPSKVRSRQCERREEQGEIDLHPRVTLFSLLFPWFILDISWKHRQQRTCEELHFPSHFLSLHPNPPQILGGLHHDEGGAIGLWLRVTYAHTHQGRCTNVGRLDKDIHIHKKQKQTCAVSSHVFFSLYVTIQHILTIHNPYIQCVDVVTMVTKHIRTYHIMVQNVLRELNTCLYGGQIFSPRLFKLSTLLQL